uniref:Establishment of sister chromatid cohesion N-acetyltransferase 1 n=1 Tax=Leptobrachium leishanense TaxID=445787 RepID=A0A8C5W8R4_9ANUR
MASQKRKSSSLVGQTAKRQKTSPSGTSKKRNSISVKAKVQPRPQKNKPPKHKCPPDKAKKKSAANKLKANQSPQKKIAKKPPVKSPTKKAISKPSEKPKTVEPKKARSKLTKNVPAKKCAIKQSKAATTSLKASAATVKSLRRSRVDVARSGSKRATTHNQKSSAVKRSSKSPLTSRPRTTLSPKKAQSTSGSKKRAIPSQNKGLLVGSGSDAKLKNQPKTSSGNSGQKKPTDGALLRKSQRVIIGKPVNEQKEAKACKIASASPKETCKDRHSKPPKAALTASDKNGTKSTRSKKLAENHSNCPPPVQNHIKRKGTKAKEVPDAKNSPGRKKTKKPTETKQKSNKCTISEKSQSKDSKSEVLSSVSLIEDKVGGPIKASVGSSNAHLSKKTSVLKHPKSTVPLAAPLKRKGGAIKTVVKWQKRGQSDDHIRQLPSDDPKSKRISILDLCNEIAGEIESDTVQVVKETQSCEVLPKVMSPLEERKEEVKPGLQQAGSSEESPSKCFFPSKKSPHLKSKLEVRSRQAQRNTKWNKIKLKKRNSFGHNVPRNRTVLPTLDAIKAKVAVLTRNQPVASTMNSTKIANKDSNTAKAEVGKADILENKIVKISDQKDLPEKSTENGVLENHTNHDLEVAFDEGFRLHLESSPENTPLKKGGSPVVGKEAQDCVSKQLFHNLLTKQMAASSAKGSTVTKHSLAVKPSTVTTEADIQKEIRKLKAMDQDSNKQPIIDAGQKSFGTMSCSICGMLYTASNPEDEAQHLLFHNQFISAVKYVGWKKERLVAEYPDGKVIMVLPDDPRYALKKVKEIREMVDKDLGFQQAPLRLHSRTKTLLFITNDKKVAGCLIAEHIQWGYRVIDDKDSEDNLEKESAISERVKAWCCSTTQEPAICGISRIWVFSMMRRRKIASRMLECLRSHFIYGSYLNKDEIAFSDPTPDGKSFATHYCGTSRFLVYNFVNGHTQTS